MEFADVSERKVMVHRRPSMSDASSESVSPVLLAALGYLRRCWGTLCDAEPGPTLLSHMSLAEFISSLLPHPYLLGISSYISKYH